MIVKLYMFSNILNVHRCGFRVSEGMPSRWNDHMIALMNAERDTVQYRSRTSRLAKWRELVTKAHADLELPTAAPEALQYLASNMGF